MLAVMFVHSGCVERLEELEVFATEHVSFKATLNGFGTTLPVKGFNGMFEVSIEDWEVEMKKEPSTKVDLYNSLNNLEAGVYGYVYSGVWNDTRAPLGVINGHKYTFDGDQLDAESPVRWSLVDGEISGGSIFRTFVYAPREAVTPTYENSEHNTGAPVIRVSDVLALQKDIIVADNQITIDQSNKSHRKEMQLDFVHICTAIQFKAGFDCTIQRITISDISTGGDYVIGSGWKLSSEKKTYSMNIPAGGLSVSKGDIIGDMVLMLPQSISSENTKIILQYKENGAQSTISTSLKGVEWKQGKKITYTLMKESDRKYIYMDLAAGGVTINSNKYEGYVFAKNSSTGNREAIQISGTIGPGQSYYIYQSCVTDANISSHNYKVGYDGYDATTKKFTGSFTLPSYPAVEYDDKLWSDYITNNDNVERVIEAWDNSTGANGNTGIVKTKAVRKAGRESTKNYISVKGSVGACVMVLDNIYCSKQYQGANRSYGSVGFLPTWNSSSSLTLNLIGDSRLGCIHYDNKGSSTNGSESERISNNNFLIIEGEGSLTVADADFYKSNGGYYSNHYDSAIGSSDSRNATYGIVINGGTLFAGTTAAENSSAIGGGGNGYGEVIINGGVVTAVASTTGTAIGGGIGFSQTGGLGYVEINGGNVYAYNHEHSSKIPSSAIGGAGSSASAGSKGTVKITGGNVYAQSALGTAIGGGSSQTKAGGEGEVIMTGGTVIAKSLSPISAGIGGGSTCTGGGSLSTPNGGQATITIGDPADPTKHPVLRTGSIGGGGTAAIGGTVGSAVIKVYGGDIQAQFVMAQSSGNTFIMDGGLIRNSSTSDDTYYCIKGNGGAVYMEQGSFTMSGGKIRACSADKSVSSKGGAVYIKGDKNTTFTMTGGEIYECKANADGGAVYLEGGKVTISGGKIYRNVASNGNGGAISILGGSFLMNDTDAFITQNAAFNSGSGASGNGGGIYISPDPSNSSATVEVTLEKGNITGNSSDGNGGGVCVDMGSDNPAKLNVIVGEVSDNAATDALKISGNNAQIKGGGMYVNGANASVTLNDGYVLDNGTSSYRVNQNIIVDGGLVTLKKPGITTQVTITFNNNAQYYIQGGTDVLLEPQYVVADSMCQLNANEFVGGLNAYYSKFKGWNTRRDGKGTSYTDGQISSFNEDITLYAQWANE